ncbi:MAG: sulfotransferase, partial [Planctomycetota bacterium]
HRDRIVPALYRLAQDVTRQQVAAWREEADADTATPSLLTGLPRSGTTLLARVVGAHPSVAAGDEFDVFPRLVLPALVGGAAPERITAELLDSLPEDHVARQRRAYYGMLGAAIGEVPPDATVIDKNPSLLPLVAPFLRTSPHAKLIVALRDPRDVLISCLATFFPLNDFSVDFLKLDSAVQRIEADIETWLHLKGKAGENWLEVRYENLVMDLPAEAERIARFLGLPWDERVLRYRDEDRVPVQSPSYAQVDLPVYAHAVGRWANYRAQLAPVMPRLDRLAIRLGYGAS